MLERTQVRRVRALDRWCVYVLHAYLQVGSSNRSRQTDRSALEKVRAKSTPLCSLRPPTWLRITQRIIYCRQKQLNSYYNYMNFACMAVHSVSRCVILPRLANSKIPLHLGIAPRSSLVRSFWVHKRRGGEGRGRGETPMLNPRRRRRGEVAARRGRR